MPTIPQSERHGERLAVVYYNESTQTWEQRPLYGDSVGNASVIDGITQVPRYSHSPTVGGVECKGMRIVGGASDVIESARFVANPGDIVLAADDLSMFIGDCKRVAPGQPHVLSIDASSGTYITDVYLTVVGTAEADAVQAISDAGTTKVGDMVTWNETAANLLSNDSIVHLEFASAKAIQAVVITLDVNSDANDGELIVEGLSDVA